MQNFQKIRNSHVIPEEEYVHRKYKCKKHQRKQRREDKRNFDINPDKQEFGKNSLRR